MSAYETAKSYTDRGWPVFPCRHAPEESIDRETGEVVELGAKTPYTWNGFRSASVFPNVIERWWRDHPDALTGIPTGERIGAWVLDIDIKHLPDGGVVDGYETLAALEAKHDKLPRTARAKTAGGGTHYYFRHVKGVRNRGALGAGIDVRGDGGYVIAPGSVRGDGKSYDWIETPEQAGIADAPQWLLDLVVRKPPPATTSSAPSANTNHAYVDAAIDRELTALAAVGMGQGRNIELNKASFSLGTFVGAGALAESEARALLQDVARGWGRDWTKCCKTIENGLKDGIRNPRHIPDREDEVDQASLANINRMIENTIRKQKEKEATKTTASAPAEAASTGAAPAPPPPADSPPGDDTPIYATPFRWIDPKTLPRREFAFGTHYIRKFVSVTVSPGGLGKTSNSIVESLSMTSGRILTGTKPPGRLRVWLFNAEDPRDEMERRIMAACLHYKLKPEDIEGHLFLDSGREQELVIAREDKKRGIVIHEPIVEAVVAQIQRNKIDVMIVDPFVSTHQVNENDNGAIDRVAKLWAQIADYTNCAVDVVHHLRKVSDREATVEDARGAVALIGAARSVRVLNRMSEDQAAQAGVKPEERSGHFSITYGKSNLTPLSSKMDWRRLVSVALGNGQGAFKPQDHAPVVTEWHWPTAEEIASEVPTSALEHIKVLIDNGDYRASEQAKDWAGIAVGMALKLDVDVPSEKKKIKTLLKKWEKDGHFVQHRLTDRVKGRMVPFYKSNKWVNRDPSLA